MINRTRVEGGGYSKHDIITCSTRVRFLPWSHEQQQLLLLLQLHFEPEQKKWMRKTSAVVCGIPPDHQAPGILVYLIESVPTTSLLLQLIHCGPSSKYNIKTRQVRLASTRSVNPRGAAPDIIYLLWREDDVFKGSRGEVAAMLFVLLLLPLFLLFAAAVVVAVVQQWMLYQVPSTVFVSFYCCSFGYIWVYSDEVDFRTVGTDRSVKLRTLYIASYSYTMRGVLPSCFISVPSHIHVRALVRN